MLTIGQRIKCLREKKDISLSALAEITDIKKSGLSSYENDKYEPSAKALISLSKALNTSTDWILTGKENNHFSSPWIQDLTEEDQQDLEVFLEFLKLRRKKKKTSIGSTIYTTNDDPPIAATKEDPIVYLPILGDAAAGVPIEIIEVYQGEMKVNGKHDRSNSFIIRARGDSMIDASIKDGDLVVFKTQPTVANGEIALVSVNGEATIKYFYLHDTKCELRSANPAYPPMEYSAGDINILGRFVEVLDEK